MQLYSNRIQFSKQDIFNQIKKTTSEKLDMSFTEEKNFIPFTNFSSEIDSIKNNPRMDLFPLIEREINAGSIVLSKTDSVKSSIVYAIGADANDSIKKVFVNLTRIIKPIKDIDKSGNPYTRYNIIGGFKELYGVLCGAYSALKAQEIYRDDTIAKNLCETYTDIMAMIFSMGKIGNPNDGEKLRYISDYFFYNGYMTYEEVTKVFKFGENRANVLASTYPDFFAKNKRTNFEELLKLIDTEFKTFNKEVTLPLFTSVAINALRDSGIYILDNQVYYLAVLIAKSQGSTMFPGYAFKKFDSKATLFWSAVKKVLL